MARQQAEPGCSALLAWNLNVKDGNRVSTTRKLKSIRYKWWSRRFERFSRHYHFPSPPSCYFLFARFRAFALRAIRAVLRAWNAADARDAARSSPETKKRYARCSYVSKPCGYGEAPYGLPISSDVSRFILATVYRVLYVILRSLFSTLMVGRNL